MSKRLFCGLLAAALALGLAFRLARLDARPMHHDEANQAVKFGALLERGEYRYDRADHHGPTLYYATLPAAWLRGQPTLAALDETTVRAVPVLFGAALVLLIGLLAPRLGRPAAAAGALLAAVSPALTYYSRDYIQEPLFAFLSLAFLATLAWWFERPSRGRAVLCGLSAGLAMATKETWVLTLPAALAACALPAWRAHRLPRLTTAHLLAAIGTAALVIAAFYSSFFTNPAGPIEWLRSFPIYGARGVEGGAHAQPWWYYLGTLCYSHAEGTTWSEGLVVGLALIGIAGAFWRREDAFWPRAVTLYAVLTTVAFSALPYKTPWNLVPFYAGLVVMAGFGTATLFDLVRPRLARAALAVLLAAATTQLGLQAWRANVRYPADPRNPYVYAQTSPDFLNLVERVEDLAAVHPDGKAMLVKVVADPYEQWPLPWYLRSMTRVGYWTDARTAGDLRATPVVVASQDVTPALDASLGDATIREYYGLRPDVLLTVYVDQELWERYLATRR